MKILHVFDHSIPLHSGYTFRSRAILEHQHRLGWETDHITSPKHNIAAHPDSEEEIVNGLHFFRTRPETRFLARLPILNQLAIVSALEKRLNAIIPEVKPDIIHAHSPALNGRAAISAARRFGIPVVYEIRAFWEDAAVDHGTTRENSIRYRLTRAMETRVVEEANAVTTICYGLKSDLVKRGIEEAKITVIPNGVDADKFVYDIPVNLALQNAYGLENKVVLGFIGSFYAYEGINLIIRALPELIKHNSDIRFLLVGGGPEERNIKDLIVQQNVEDYVIMTGRVPHDEVQDYYNLVDVFLYPRLPMRLTDLVTPLKPLEAMAQKKLVIASNVGGHRELIRDESLGVLFEAGDVQSLVCAVSTLLNEPEKWGNMKEAGRKYVEEIRSWANSVRGYKEVYGKLREYDAIN